MQICCIVRYVRRWDITGGHHIPLNLLFNVEVVWLCYYIFTASEGCRPLEYKMCEYNEDCCSYNCSKKHKDQKYGVCKILIFNDELPNEPISNLSNYTYYFVLL